jgi:hypothetical protein
MGGHSLGTTATTTLGPRRRAFPFIRHSCQHPAPSGAWGMAWVGVFAETPA